MARHVCEYIVNVACPGGDLQDPGHHPMRTTLTGGVGGEGGGRGGEGGEGGGGGGRPTDEMHLASTRRNWPTGRGFERFYGFLGAETNQWIPT